MLLELLPENERLAAIQAKDHKGQSLLQICIRKPELIKITLGLLPIEQRLAIIKQKDLFGNSILLNSLSNPTLFNEILNIFPVQQRIEIMKERDFYGYSILNKSTSNPQMLEIVLKTLPEEIAFVIKECLKELKPSKSEKPILSMITFIDDMKKLNNTDSIKAFVHALVNNADIEKSLNALLSPPSSNSFFKSNSNEAIQECINKLDSHWLNRIPKIGHDTPTIELPDQPKKQ